jgi:hypothetical protein
VRILNSHRVFSVAGMVYVEDMERHEAIEIPSDSISSPPAARGRIEKTIPQTGRGLRQARHHRR